MSVTHRLRRAVLIAGALAAISAPAGADARPRGTYRWAPPARVNAAPLRPSSNVIYMNRCAGGCTVTPGFEDSRTNHSSIIERTAVLDEFPHGDEAWDEVVACVRAIYEPFDIVVTDVDPGDQPHFETMVAGDPEDVGQPENVGGVSPFTCGVIENAITFDFANLWTDMRQLCEVVAQETAHAFGLDHEYLCTDPMTYLTGCGEKFFRDQDAPCGEYEPRDCMCGGQTQNSYRRIVDAFSASRPPDAPPTVAITSPADGADVIGGFRVEVTADDDGAVASVDAYLDGAPLGRDVEAPFTFAAPAYLPVGDLILRVVATDDRGDTASHTIHLTGVLPCVDDDGCNEGEVCSAGLCVEPAAPEAALGAPCDRNEDCKSGMCGDDGDERRCAAPCDDGACPPGFECVSGGTGGLCWQRRHDDGGCRAAPAATGAELVGPAFLLALLLRRRRRART